MKSLMITGAYSGVFFGAVYKGPAKDFSSSLANDSASFKKYPKCLPSKTSEQEYNLKKTKHKQPNSKLSNVVTP